MNWTSLNKEQKQKILLGVIVGAAALYALVVYVVKPIMSGSGDARAELENLTTSIDEARLLIAGRDSMKERELEIAGEMKTIRNERLPETANPLSWVTTEIYRSARDAGVDVETVEEVRLSGGPWLRPEAARHFQPYRVKITLQCGYFELMDLVRLLEERHPYLTVMGVDIAPRRDDPLRHMVTLLIEWPSQIDPELFATGGAPPAEPEESS